MNEWIKEESSLMGMAHVMQHDPYVINLLESRSFFPSETCLHFPHVRLGKWDILSLTGHFCAPQLTTILHRCQLKPLLGHVGDQNFWITSSKQNPSSFSSLPAASHPNSSLAPLQVSPAPERRHTSGKGEDGQSTWIWLRAFLCKKFCKEEKSLNFCDYSFIKTWELEKRYEGSWGFFSHCSSFRVRLQFKFCFYYLLTRDVTLGGYYLNLIFLNRKSAIFRFGSRRTS